MVDIQRTASSSELLISIISAVIMVAVGVFIGVPATPMVLLIVFALALIFFSLKAREGHVRGSTYRLWTNLHTPAFYTMWAYLTVMILTGVILDFFFPDNYWEYMRNVSWVIFPLCFAVFLISCAITVLEWKSDIRKEKNAIWEKRSGEVSDREREIEEEVERRFKERMSQETETERRLRELEEFNRLVGRKDPAGND